MPELAIDSLHLRRCDFIKIDVEGMEEEVLQGAERTLREYQPIVYMEAGTDEEEGRLSGHMHELGYRVYRHRPPLYHPGNYFHNPRDVFSFQRKTEDGRTERAHIVSLNLLCVPSASEFSVKGLQEV